MAPMSSEIELKFHIPAARLAAVTRAVATRTAVVEPLAALYFDTPDQHLAQARVALRLRREGEYWVQTLKAEGATAMQRLEHNVPVPMPIRPDKVASASASPPALDLARHEGSDAGVVLARVLAQAGNPPLQARYATQVQRTRRVLRHGGALIELALDRGHITSGERQLPICELEFELLRGTPQALLDVAARWVDRFDLVLDVRSKSELGHLLAAGLAMSPPASARPLRLAREATVADALAAMLANPLGQVLANASPLADGPAEPEHLHQLRVGLRRLRTVLKVYGALLPTALQADMAFNAVGVPASGLGRVNDGEPAPTPSLVAALATLFGQLGAARDQDAMDEWLWPALRLAGSPLVDRPNTALQNPGPDLAALLSTPATQHLWLALLGACQPGVMALETGLAAVKPVPLRRALSQPLQRLQRQVRRDAARFTELDDAARHRLRRRIKRLRYASELVGALWPAKNVARYLACLQQAQSPLGEFNDTVVALACCRSLTESDPRAWFAVGWLAARLQTLAAPCAKALKCVARQRGFWR